MGRLPFVRHLMSMNFEGILRLRCGQQEAVLFRCVLSELAIGVIPFFFVQTVLDKAGAAPAVSNGLFLVLCRIYCEA